MIVLTVLSYNGAPVDGLVASFDELGGSVGRADNNQLVLPDSDRTISRVHARIVFRNGGYAIVDVGSNPIALNTQAMGNGREMAIRDGDELTIGGYRIVVSFGQKAAPKDPFADLFGTGKTDLLGPAASALAPKTTPPLMAPPPPPMPPMRGAEPPAARPAWPAQEGTIPDDWDPFAPDRGGAAESAFDMLSSAPPSAASPYLAELPMAAPSQHDTLDALFGLGAGSAPADPFAHTPMATPLSQPNMAADADPLRALGMAPGVVAAPVADHGSELNAAWRAPQLSPTPAHGPGPALPAGAVLSWEPAARAGRVVVLGGEPRGRAPAQAVPRASPAFVARPAAAPAARPMAAPSSPASAAPDELLQAFLEGLGAPDLRLGALDAERMRSIGELLRESTRGTVELLVARATFKREMRANVTMIAPRENNPLKFSPTVEAALQHLLAHPAPGFMPPVVAVRDAYDDLCAHQLGVMAGMRSALEGVLRRFEPAVLEGRLAKRSALSKLLPGSAKAQLWDLFQSLYAQLSEEATEDFHELFGKAFLNAYEAHMDELKRHQD